MPPARRPRRRAISHTNAIPSRVNYEQQDASLIKYRLKGHPTIGTRFQIWAATRPTVPHGPWVNESVIDPAPLLPVPPGLPTTPNGAFDIGAILQPGVTTTQGGLAGHLANRISHWCTASVAADGKTYGNQSADGKPRAYPEPPAGGVWHGPNLFQHVNATCAGQIDVIYAITKGGLHCGNPNCRKPLNLWALPNDHDNPCLCRQDHYRWHDGMRGATAVENNLKVSLGCTTCASKGEH